jgi:hypothetical protein
MDVLALDLQAPTPGRTRRRRPTADRSGVVELPGVAARQRDDDQARFTALCRSIATGDSHALARGRDWLRPGW